jgi:tetratricopeptide (TPR) repeat protein
VAETKASELLGNSRTFYDKSVEAMRRENYDYAIELLTQLIKKEPQCWEARMKLRETAMAKQSKGKSFFKKVMNTAGSGAHLAKAQMAMAGEPLEALAEAEIILLSDPVNVMALKISAEAALRLEFIQTARLTLQRVHQLAPEDREANARLANLYCDLGSPELAEQVYAVLMRHHPNDQELQMEAKNIAARRTLDQGGYENAHAEGGTFRKLLKDVDQAERLERESRMVKDEATMATLLAEYEQRLENEPENVKLICNIAELHAESGDFYRSLQYYNLLDDIEGAKDAKIRRDIFLVAVKCFDQAIEDLDRNLPDYAETRAKYEQERDEFIMTDCKDRVEHYPTDMGLRYEYGELLFGAGRVQEAIAQLQRSQANPHYKIKGQLLISKCFSALGMKDLAVTGLQEAVNEKSVMDQEKKELIYTLGVVLEEMARYDEAIEQFKQIFAIDINYLDVAKRVEEYYKRGKGAK